MQSRIDYSKPITQLYDRQGGRCFYCKRGMFLISLRDTAHPLFATLEHRNPKVFGGQDKMENYAASCRQCNHLKNALAENSFVNLLAYCGGNIHVLTEALHGTKARTIWEKASELPIPEQPTRHTHDLSRAMRKVLVKKAMAELEARKPKSVPFKPILLLKTFPTTKPLDDWTDRKNVFADPHYSTMKEDPNSLFPWTVELSLFSGHELYDPDDLDRNKRFYRTKSLDRAKKLALHKIPCGPSQTAVRIGDPEVGLIWLYQTVEGFWRWTDDASADGFLSLEESMESR